MPGELLSRFRQIPRLERWALVLVITVLTVGPVLISISRTGPKRVHIVLSPVPHARQAPAPTLAYVRQLVERESQNLAQGSSSGATNLPSRGFLRSLSIAAPSDGPDTDVTITATSRSPRTASAFLTSLAAGITATSRGESAIWLQSTDVLPVLQHSLATPLPPAQRRRLVKELKFIRAAIGFGRPAGPLRAAGAVIEREGFWGRLIARLPGNPSRPSAVWAGLAGFLLALALCFGWIYVVRGGEGSPGGAAAAGIDPAGA